jgi:hypothetical protein
VEPEADLVLPTELKTSGLSSDVSSWIGGNGVKALYELAGRMRRRERKKSKAVPPMRKATDSTKVLLRESLHNASASITLDLWGTVAIRAIHEAKPVEEILIEALGDYLKKPLKPEWRRAARSKRFHVRAPAIGRRTHRNSYGLVDSPLWQTAGDDHGREGYNTPNQSQSRLVRHG